MNLFQKTAGAVAAVTSAATPMVAGAQPASHHTERTIRVQDAGKEFQNFADPIAFVAFNTRNPSQVDPDKVGIPHLLGLDTSNMHLSAKVSGPATVQKSEFSNAYRVGLNLG